MQLTQSDHVKIRPRNFGSFWGTQFCNNSLEFAQSVKFKLILGLSTDELNESFR